MKLPPPQRRQMRGTDQPKMKQTGMRLPFAPKLSALKNLRMALKKRK